MSFLWRKKEKEDKNEDPRIKDFWRLVHSLPRWPRKQFENGIPCFYDTCLIRIKRLEKGYLKDPDLVNRYFRLCRPIRCEGNLISISGKYASYLEELFLSKLGLTRDRDYFYVSSWICLPDDEDRHKLSPEELDQEARKSWEASFLSYLFDFVKIERNYIVIRPRPDMDAILDKDKLYQETVGDYRASIAEAWRQQQKEDEQKEWEEFRKQRSFPQIDFKDLTVCSTCGKIYGKVKVNDRIFYQDCDCGKYPAPPGGEKCNRYRLCHYCGLDVFELFGKYYGRPILSCPKCREDVLNFKKFFNVDTFSSSSMPHEIYKLINPYLYYLGYSNFLALEEVWLKLVVRRNLALLRFFEDIPLEDYLFLVQKRLKWIRFLNFRDRILFYFHYLDVKSDPRSFFPIILPIILI